MNLLNKNRYMKKITEWKSGKWNTIIDMKIPVEEVNRVDPTEKEN